MKFYNGPFTRSDTLNMPICWQTVLEQVWDAPYLTVFFRTKTALLMQIDLFSKAFSLAELGMLGAIFPDGQNFKLLFQQGDVGSSVLLWGVVLIFLLVFGIIFFMKKKYKQRSLEGGASSIKEGVNALIARNKYPGVDIFRYSSSFFYGGLVLALLTSILAFNWTTYTEAVYIPEGALELDEEIVQEPPRTAEPPPPPPPPPPPVIEEVPEELIEEEDEPEFIDQSIEEETEVAAEPVEEVKNVPPPPPPPPPPAPKVEEIFKVVEQMPMFPGCENSGGSNDEMQACATKKMLEYIYGNIKYPAIARENGVEGTAVITFVVEKDGKITDAKIVRDPGAQTGSEALRVVQTFPKWTPGKQRGQPVRVQFNLPVKFKLE